jgi:hypothetical protein
MAASSHYILNGHVLHDTVRFLIIPNYFHSADCITETGCVGIVNLCCSPFVYTRIGWSVSECPL